MTKYQSGDYVWIPSSQLDPAGEALYALTRVKVDAVEGRSLIYTHRGDQKAVGSRKAHSDDLGVTLVEIGDGKTEEYLLDPIADSLGSFLKLLLPSERLRLLKVRTQVELTALWPNLPKPTIVILVGHASSKGYKFVDSASPVPATDFGGLFNFFGAPGTVVTLGCQTGKAGFAKNLSSSVKGARVMGPVKPVHGAVASQFTTVYLTERLLNGMEELPAYKQASESVSSAFRLWQQGKHIAS